MTRLRPRTPNQHDLRATRTQFPAIKLGRQGVCAGRILEPRMIESFAARISSGRNFQASTDGSQSAGESLSGRRLRAPGPMQGGEPFCLTIVLGTTLAKSRIHDGSIASSTNVDY